MRALAVVCALGATASAEARLDLRIEGDEIHARVRGADNAEPVFLFGEAQPAIRATSVRGFAEAGPVGIAFVVQADELLFRLWDNDEWQPDVDLFTPYVEAFDRLDLGASLPPGSEALLVTYNTRAAVRAPWQPASSFSGAALGKPIDYKGTIGTDLHAGVGLAVSEVDRKPFGRKIVFVLGDGNDTNNEAAKPSLLAIARDRPDILFVALRIRSPISPDGHLLGMLTPLYRDVQPAGIEAGMKGMLEHAKQQFDATFPLAKFEHDGAAHEYTLKAGGADVASASLLMPKRPPPPPPSTLWRWFIVGGVASIFALVALVMVRSKGPR